MAKSGRKKQRTVSLKVEAKLNAKEKKPLSLGALSFLFGVVIAAIAGIISPEQPSATLTSLLILLGIVVGLQNITTRESRSFIIATGSLVIVSALGGAVLGQVFVIGGYLSSVLRSILTFVVPAAIIVALKVAVKLAED